VGRAVVLDFDASLTATVTNGVADVDSTGGGGGGSLAISLDGGALTAAATSLDATEGLFASAVSTAVTFSVFGVQAGTLASRPAAARSNKRGLWIATDTGAWYVSDGATWTALAGFLVATSNLSDVASVATSRDNLNVYDRPTTLALAVALG
jgi:hypothetical protein